MPEKGWSIITIRNSTKKKLLDMSKKEGKSINDVIEDLLNHELKAISTSQIQYLKESKIININKLTSQDIEYED